jgi:hypothetical protein
MTDLKVTFTKDKAWKKFVLFKIDEKALSLDTEPPPKRKLTAASGFGRIERNFVSIYETFFLHFPFRA